MPAVACRHAHEWQPIETAPRDGTEILVFRQAALKQPIGVDKFNRYGQWTYSDQRHPPTHWMPLPAPPDAVVDIPHEGKVS